MEVDDKQVACFQNPVLDADAWTRVYNNYPTDEGVYAVLVCRFACPLLDDCPFGDGPGFEVIAKGGWFNAGGKFTPPPDGEIDLRHGAAYIGIGPETLRLLITKKDIPTVQRGPRLYMKTSDLQQLAVEHGPRHGTFAMYKLHLIRGEKPCQYCVTANSDEQDATGLLPSSV